MKMIVAQAFCGQLVHRRRRNAAAKRSELAEPAIVDEDEENVRRALRGLRGLGTLEAEDQSSAVEIEALAAAEMTKRRISAIGLGAPGVVDNQRGLVVYATNLPGWKNIALAKALRPVPAG